MLHKIAPYVIDYSARGIAEGVSRAIRDGTVPPGTKLPPIRHMADQFQCSPSTVLAAWGLLTRAGLIQTDRRRGTVVVEQAQARPGRYRETLIRPSRQGLDLASGTEDDALLPSLGSAIGRLRYSPTRLPYLSDPVLPSLRDHLATTWPFPAEMITVTDGSMDAIDLFVTTHLQHGDRVAVENPCFPPLIDLLTSAGARIVPVEVDESGPIPVSLATALEVAPRAFFVQPRAQNPTGTSMNSERRDELAALLGHTDVIVVENDSINGVTAAAMHSIGTQLSHQTVHVRSFSKSHGPDLRLAAVGGARHIVEPMVNRRFLGQSWTSHLLQGLLLDLLTDPAAVTQVQLASAEYARRREALRHALHERGVSVGSSSGLNLWLPVLDESATVRDLASKQIWVAPGSLFALTGAADPHVRVTTAQLAEVDSELADTLAAACLRATAT